MTQAARYRRGLRADIARLGRSRCTRGNFGRTPCVQLNIVHGDRLPCARLGRARREGALSYVAESAKLAFISRQQSLLSLLSFPHAANASFPLPKRHSDTLAHGTPLPSALDGQRRPQSELRRLIKMSRAPACKYPDAKGPVPQPAPSNVRSQSEEHKTRPGAAPALAAPGCPRKAPARPSRSSPGDDPAPRASALPCCPAQIRTRSDARVDAATDARGRRTDGRAPLHLAHAGARHLPCPPNIRSAGQKGARGSNGRPGGAGSTVGARATPTGARAARSAGPRLLDSPSRLRAAASSSDRASERPTPPRRPRPLARVRVRRVPPGPRARRTHARRARGCSRARHVRASLVMRATAGTVAQAGARRGEIAH